MLRECFRVMRPNGKIRISTPDLKFLIELYADDKSALQSAYIRWSTETFSPRAAGTTDTFVINNFVRNWGHNFIYDEKTLRGSLLDAGFQSVVKCALQESAASELRNLENEARAPPGFLRLETLTLEAQKTATN
jgi:predicted SAM-dependent methyltransferase